MQGGTEDDGSLMVVANEIITNQALSPEVIIAKIFLSSKISGNLQMDEVAELIAGLDKHGVDTSKMLCYPTGSTIYCEDLDKFVSKFVSFGFAKDSSPIKLTDKGKEICERIVENSASAKNEHQLKKLDKFLKEY